MTTTLRLPRRKFTNEMKKTVLSRINNHRTEGMSIKEACAIENIRFNYYYRWNNTLKIKSRGSESVHSNPSVPYLNASNAFSLFLSQAKPGSFFAYVKE